MQYLVDSLGLKIHKWCHVLSSGAVRLMEVSSVSSPSREAARCRLWWAWCRLHRKQACSENSGVISLTWQEPSKTLPVLATPSTLIQRTRPGKRPPNPGRHHPQHRPPSAAPGTTFPRWLPWRFHSRWRIPTFKSESHWRVMTVVCSGRVLGSLPATGWWISCRVFTLMKCYHSFAQFSFFLRPSYLLDHQILSTLDNLKPLPPLRLRRIITIRHPHCSAPT